MKHVYCLLVFFVFVVSNLNAQKFSVPESYSIEKNPKIACPMECVGYKEDSLVFYCIIFFIIIKENIFTY